jgi:hypothetical protein
VLPAFARPISAMISSARRRAAAVASTSEKCLSNVFDVDADRARDLDLTDAMMRHGGNESGIPVIEAESAPGHAPGIIP